MSETVTATLLELLSKLFGGDEELRNEYLDNPDKFIEKYELEDLSCDDFNDAVLAFVDNTVEGSEYNLGGKFYADKDEHDGDHHEAVKTVIKKIVEEGDTYHVTNNNYDNDTVYDQSFKGTLLADGDVTFDNDIAVADGDGAVAAGDDITGDVATGDDNFNEGTIVKGDQVADDGSNISSGENSVGFGGRSEDNDITEDNDVVVDTTTITDNSSETEFEDSFNDNRDNSDNSDNSFDQEVHVEDTDDTAVVTNP